RRLWFAGALLIAIYGFAELASGDLPAALACLPLFGVSFNYIRANLNAEQNEPSGTEKVLYALIYVLLTASLSYCCAQLAGAEF
ncbi:MAG: hypothetical protein K2Z81_04520, partial [Cyanobacteria bacterium]|nr:hypothetical protein [Cyanobacteriota bacterium]